MNTPQNSQADRRTSGWAPTPFLPKEASRDQWSKYHAFRKTRHQERDPDEPLSTDKVVEDSMKIDELYWRHKRYVVEAGEHIAGFCCFESPMPNSPEYESTRHILYADFAVIGQFRRNGIGTELLRGAVAELDRLGARVLTSWTSEDAGRAFAAWCGAETKQVERMSRLDFGTVDWDTMEQWVADLKTRASGASLELYPDRLPDSMIEEFCPARTELMNLMPWDDAEHGDIVVTPEDIDKMYEQLDVSHADHHNYLAREADGTISGMTDVVRRPDHPGEIEQWFTGVNPKFGGRGVGKALKAAMMLYLRDRYDGLVWMRTGNSTTNGAMLSINERMGFEEYRRYNVYQIARDDLASFLNSLPAPI
jgi:GNAT superfamily N-acetyltransferase